MSENWNNDGLKMNMFMLSVDEWNAQDSEYHNGTHDQIGDYTSVRDSVMLPDNITHFVNNPEFILDGVSYRVKTFKRSTLADVQELLYKLWVLFIVWRLPNGDYIIRGLVHK